MFFFLWVANLCSVSADMIRDIFYLNYQGRQCIEEMEDGWWLVRFRNKKTCWAGFYKSLNKEVMLKYGCFVVPLFLCFVSKRCC